MLASLENVNLFVSGDVRGLQDADELAKLIQAGTSQLGSSSAHASCRVGLLGVHFRLRDDKRSDYRYMY